MNKSISIELDIKVITGAKQVSFERKNGMYLVRLTSRPEKGRANEQLVRVLSDKLNIAQSRIKIISGLKSKLKKVRVN